MTGDISLNNPLQYCEGGQVLVIHSTWVSRVLLINEGRVLSVKKNDFSILSSGRCRKQVISLSLFNEYITTPSFQMSYNI